MSNLKKRSINPVDIVMLVVLLLALCAFVFSFFSGVGEGGKKKITYVLEVSRIQSDFCQKVNVGDSVYDYDSSKLIGQVSAVSQTPAVHVGVGDNGEAVNTEIEGYSTLYITVTADALGAPDGYSINGLTVNAGRSVSVRLPGLYCDAVCVSTSQGSSQDTVQNAK